MNTHDNLQQYTNGNEVFYKQALGDYLQNLSGTYISASKMKPDSIIEVVFDLFSYAAELNPGQYPEFKGNTVSPGLLSNFMEAFNIFFLKNRQPDGKVVVNSMSFSDAKQVDSLLQKGMETYAKLVALNINELKTDVQANWRTFTLGTWFRKITQLLDERCSFANPTLYSLLLSDLNKIPQYRNSESHNNLDLTYLWQHINDMLVFIVVAAFVRRIIYLSRYGYMRLTTDMDCKVSLYLNDKEIGNAKIFRQSSSSQIKGRFQINFKEEWKAENEYTLQFKAIDTNEIIRQVSVKPESKYSDYHFSMEEEKPAPDLSEEDKPKKKIMPLVSFPRESDRVLTHSFRGGAYIGSINEEGLPHGRGRYTVDNLAYEGKFADGEPVGDFTVHYEDNDEPFTYHGTLTKDFTADNGMMTKKKQQRAYSGQFEEWFLKKGSKFADGKLVYEGEFINLPTTKGVNMNLYHGKGKLYTEEGVFTGEFNFNKKVGKGVFTYNDPAKKAYKGVWIDDMCIEKTEIEEPDEKKQEDNEATTIKTVLLAMVLPDRPFCMTDANGTDLVPFIKGNKLEIAPESSLTVWLQDDSSIQTSFKVSSIPGMYECWNIKQQLEDVAASLPLQHTDGPMTLSDGSVYEGELKNGLPHGNGVLRMPRQTYTGGFAQGKYHGEGSILCKNGDVITGTYNYGKKNGRFTRTTSRGQTFASEWLDGNQVG
ncbi:hypothetical protein [Parabacteroides merdae]|jgi:hypothetical protein|uniref:hypothetical protein n=1 Tax=Parabacteroides merdae TaxID=46503 RepID=UPI0034A25D4D